MDIADSRTVLLYSDPSEASITPGGAPRVLDDPVIHIKMLVVSESNDSNSAVNWVNLCTALRSRDDTSLVELKLFARSGDSSGDRAELDGHSELLSVMR